MKFITQNPALMRYSRLVVAMATASGLILGGALFGQYVLDWHPCELCLYQRYPYMAIIMLAAIGLLFRRRRKIQQALAIAGIVLFLVTAGIGAYHTGVEMKWIAGPSGCSAGSGQGLTLEQMRAEIMGAPLVSCDQAMAYVLGISLAMWNAIIATFLAGLSSWLFVRIKKAGFV